jgi:2-hydroxycyclohexanecarboxyl-CoA dehydrogenase
MGILAGKVALIVGASTQGGIGEATARAYRREGATVVLSARRLPAADAIAAGMGATAVACDMTVESQVQHLVAAVLERCGRLDAVVIVAGGHASQRVDELTRETLVGIFDLNVVGPAFVIKHAARAMGRGGSIVYVSSAAADLSSFGVAAYACTKAAGERLVEIAALENASRGIRINTLQPGIMETPMSHAMLQRPGVRSAFERETPMGRLATVDEVASAAVWLASDGCFMTGDRVRVNGGIHLRRHPMPDDFKV